MVCLVEFPSPIGELHFSMNKNTIKDFNNLFPSPIGELHFSIGSEICYKEAGKLGFRPLSGSYISQLATIFIIGSYFVSVPYRGATFLNEKQRILATKLGTVSVPYRGATFLNS